MFEKTGASGAAFVAAEAHWLNDDRRSRVGWVIVVLLVAGGLAIASGLMPIVMS